MTSAERLLPLTPAQRRLWALAQVRPDDPFFSIPFAVGTDGPLDAAALGRALEEVVRRHPALRTRIVRGADGEPAQCVGAPEPVALPVVDARDDSAAVAEAFAREPFAVDGGPLLRVRLLRLDDTTHRLLVGVHHLVFDGASLEVFTSELTALYDAFAQGQPSPLPEPVVEYGAFLARRTEEDERAAAANLAYWTQRLAGSPEVLELPLAGPRPARGGHEGERRTAVIPHEVVEPLRRLARTKRCSLFMVLKAACDVVLSQYGGTDVLTGMAVSGRDTTDSAGLVGYLTRPVVLRADLSGDPEFGELLRQVRGDLLDALDHCDLPVDEVMDRLGAARDPSYHPLYQVMYTHQPAAPVRRVADAVFTVGELRLPTMKTDLAIDTIETDEGLLALVDFRTALFETATAERLLVRLRTVLERIAADPSSRVSALLRPTAGERRQLVEEWNPACEGSADGDVLHAMVSEQVARTPDAVAVVDGARTWTYRELDDAAGPLAARLLEYDVTPETPVGVCAPKSFALAAAQLGVLKAGGVCVPLDPELPAFLLRLAVDDAGLTTVLADLDSSSLFDHTRVRVVDLDEPASPAGSSSAPAAPLPVVSPANAAWVLRTSGATGEPRAVLAEHRNLASRLRWAHRELPAGTLDAVAQLSPPDSPGAVFELFAPLTGGGRVVVPDAASTGTATVNAAPSALAGFLGDGREAVPAAVLVGGELLAPAGLRAAYAAGVGSVHHLYTAAETAGPALGGPATPDGTGRPVPLGLPAGATAYVLDRRGELVPPGVVGELHIGGAAVTRGYLNDPRRTAECFRPDPYGERPGGRLFATGDLVRHTPDGRLVFAGRAREQARVRGVRVAAADIEAALLAHPGVARAHVLTPTEAGDGIDAAVAGRPGAGLTADALRAHLRELLPGYLLPTRIGVLERLPLLPGGRTDGAAVPKALAEALAEEEKAAQREAQQPLSDTEQLVAGAWQQVLGRTVGHGESFFDAGGNSLLLIRLRDRLRTALECEVDVVDLFRHSTVRAMAAFLGKGTGGRDGAGAPPVPVTATGAEERGQARLRAMRARTTRERTPGRSR
ncbi:condensation domain-containing protein [Streptomyces sp. ISL-100]|uniref:condensation domain-containing protein n=1 Tax=Streptomyces sp. ISL-100 TaxID=2819173 RepID=UPI001BEB1EC9|nr:condensation domain-containing protein [Streptomyces sp. ISL-100]MBT2398640.1 AMP-binding protein [Streptomyces sp. ISL-100]